MAGKTITYGQMIQLQHVKSSKFVTVTVKQIAELEKHCLKVALIEDGDEGSCFVVTPRFKVRSEGEAVRYGEQLLLQNMLFSPYLHASFSSYSDGIREVNSIGSPTTRVSWRFIPFSPYIPDDSSWLVGGTCIRIFHKESEAYITNERLNPEDEQPKVALHRCKSSATETDHVNSNSLWMIENEKGCRGVILRHLQHFRLKHLATGRYLACTVSDNTKSVSQTALSTSTGELVGISSETTLSSLGGSQKLPNFPLFTVPDRQSATLFEALPTSWLPDAESKRITTSTAVKKKISTEEYLLLRHVQSNWWLHAPRSQPQIHRSIDISSSQDQLEASSAAQGVTHTHPSFSEVTLQQSMSDEDAFHFQVVPKTVSDRLHSIHSQLSYIEKHIERIAAGDRADFTKSMLAANTKEVQSARQVIQVLTEMILWCTISKEMDPMKREGIEVTEFQNLLREQGVIGKLLPLIKHTMAGRNLKELGQGTNYTNYTTLNLVYRLLRQIIKSHPENRRGMGSDRAVQQLEDHIEFPSATDTLMELFRDNWELLSEFQAHQIHFFIKGLRDNQNGRLPSYVNFLSILCTCDGQRIKNNQKTILHQLVHENHHLLVSMRFRSATDPQPVLELAF